MSRNLYLITFATALLGACLVTFMGIKLHRMETETIDASFRQEVDEKVIALERELGINLETLYALKGSFSDAHEMSSGQFARTARDILSRHPHIQALEWVPRVSHPDREVAERLRRKDLPEFEFTERQEQGLMIRAADREKYFPVYYLEPIAGNELALGFDLASNPARLEALELSRDSGELVATPSITLVQEQSNQKGILTFLPIYKGRPLTIDKRRENLRGFVLGVFRIGDIFNSAIDNIGPAGGNIMLYDETIAGKREILHSYTSGEIATQERQSNYRAALGSIGGRQWVIEAFPGARYFAERRSAFPYMISVFGFVFLAFATTFSISILRRSETIEQVVLDRTKELNDANSKLERVSRTDQLTGVANRRAFDERFYEEWLRAAREKSPITLMFVDVDCFKQFNDSYGHLAGDAALKLVAGTIESSIKKPDDFVARYGGEEFAVVLPNTKNAFDFSDSIRKRIEALHIPHKGSSVAEVLTISIGMTSVFPMEDVLPDEFLHCADKALYKAKESGRNRVEVYEADTAATGTQPAVYALRAQSVRDTGKG